MDFTFSEKVLMLVALETKMGECAEEIKGASGDRLQYWREHLADYTALRTKIMKSD